MAGTQHQHAKSDEGRSEEGQRVAGIYQHERYSVWASVGGRDGLIDGHK